MCTAFDGETRAGATAANKNYDARLHQLDAMNGDNHFLSTAQTHGKVFLFHGSDNTLAIVVAESYTMVRALGPVTTFPVLLLACAAAVSNHPAL